MALVVVEQLGLPPLVDTKVLIAVVVVFGPDGPHADAGAGLVQVRNAELLGNVDKPAVPQVAVKVVLLPGLPLVT